MGRRACLERWYAWSGPRDVVAVRGHELKGPAFYHAAASVESVHRADAAAVRSVLPSDELLPVRWFDGRAAVYVSGLRYQDVTAAHADGRPWVLRPYGEFMAAVLVARRPVPRGLSVLRPDAFGVGAFVLSLPVTTVEALTLGRDLFGLPKFVADLDFQDEPASQVVTVAEDGRQVLALEVRPRGTARTYCATNVLYSSLRSELLETRVAVLGHRRVRL